MSDMTVGKAGPIVRDGFGRIVTAWLVLRFLRWPVFYVPAASVVLAITFVWFTKPFGVDLTIGLIARLLKGELPDGGAAFVMLAAVLALTTFARERSERMRRWLRHMRAGIAGWGWLGGATVIVALLLSMLWILRFGHWYSLTTAVADVVRGRTPEDLWSAAWLDRVMVLLSMLAVIAAAELLRGRAEGGDSDAVLGVDQRAHALEVEAGVPDDGATMPAEYNHLWYVHSRLGDFLRDFLTPTDSPPIAEISPGIFADQYRSLSHDPLFFEDKLPRIPASHDFHGIFTSDATAYRAVPVVEREAAIRTLCSRIRESFAGLDEKPLDDAVAEAFAELRVPNERFVDRDLTSAMDGAQRYILRPILVLIHTACSAAPKAPRAPIVELFTSTEYVDAVVRHARYVDGGGTWATPAGPGSWLVTVPLTFTSVIMILPDTWERLRNSHARCGAVAVILGPNPRRSIVRRYFRYSDVLSWPPWKWDGNHISQLRSLFDVKEATHDVVAKGIYGDRDHLACSVRDILHLIRIAPGYRVNAQKRRSTILTAVARNAALAGCQDAPRCCAVLAVPSWLVKARKQMDGAASSLASFLDAVAMLDGIAEHQQRVHEESFGALQITNGRMEAYEDFVRKLLPSFVNAPSKILDVLWQPFQPRSSKQAKDERDSEAVIAPSRAGAMLHEAQIVALPFFSYRIYRIFELAARPLGYERKLSAFEVASRIRKGRWLDLMRDVYALTAHDRFAALPAGNYDDPNSSVWIAFDGLLSALPYPRRVRRWMRDLSRQSQSERRRWNVPLRIGLGVGYAYRSGAKPTRHDLDHAEEYLRAAEAMARKALAGTSSEALELWRERRNWWSFAAYELAQVLRRRSDYDYEARELLHEIARDLPAELLIAKWEPYRYMVGNSAWSGHPLRMRERLAKLKEQSRGMWTARFSSRETDRIRDELRWLEQDAKFAASPREFVDAIRQCRGIADVTIAISERTLQPWWVRCLTAVAASADIIHG